MKSVEQIAIEAAIYNPIQNLPRMAAVLITPGGDIFVGRNQFKSHPLQAVWSRNPQSIFLHAEIDALIKYLKRHTFYYPSSIFVARVLKNNQPALAKPCSGCFGALLHFGITNIRWTT